MKPEQAVTSPQKVLFETQLRSIVHTKTGLSIDKYRMDDIWRMLDKLQATYSAFSTLSLNLLNEWVNSLALQSVESSEWRALIEVITVGETYFFRDTAQIRALQNHVLPKIIDNHRAHGFKHLKIWSAGCSTGEEAYTLAILLKEMLPDFTEWTFTILGTDINQTSLESARKGVFKPRSFRDETRPGVSERWFRQIGKDFELNPEIRQMVKFAPLNLVSDEYPSFQTETMNCDLILCRNVTIYFNETTTRQIIERFYKALSPMGWLVVGHSEPTVSSYREFTPHNVENAVVYYKDPPQYITQEIPAVIQPTSLPNRNPLSTRTTLKTSTFPVVNTIKPSLKTATMSRVSNPIPSHKTSTVQNVSYAASVSKPESLQAAQEAANHEDWNALEHWLKVAERDDNLNPQLYYLRALMFINLGELSLACDDLRRAIYCDPLFALAYYVLGEIYEKRGITREARRSWEMARQALTQIEPEHMVASGNNMTVEILQGFITYQLEKLTEG